MKLDPYFISYTKINSNQRPKCKSCNYKIIGKKNIGRKLYNIGFGKDFLDMTSKA